MKPSKYHLAICCHGFQYSKRSYGYWRRRKCHKLGCLIWHHHGNSLQYCQKHMFRCGLFLWMCDISNLPFDGLWSWHNLCLFGFNGRHYSTSFAMDFLYFGKHPYCPSIIRLPFRKLHLAIIKKPCQLEDQRPVSNQSLCNCSIIQVHTRINYYKDITFTYWSIISVKTMGLISSHLTKLRSLPQSDRYGKSSAYLKLSFFFSRLKKNFKKCCSL